MRKLNLSSFACLLVLSAWPVHGQQSSLRGTVTDPAGAVLPNTTLALESAQTGLRREATSDVAGRYIIPQVQPGTYKLTARAAGFSEVIVNNVVLEVNTPVTINVVFEKVGS